MTPDVMPPATPSRRPVDGVLLLDKPTGITSNAALMRAKRLFHAEKAGHTGTLDPLASGLLPICFGVATRFAQFLLDAPKRYLATVRFGTSTTTQDAEGEIVAMRPAAFDASALERALARFVGTSEQTPPMYSALKFRGTPYYNYARRGVEVPRVPREITVHRLAVMRWQPPDATLDVECSKGTYVRALAADLGEALECGAHLAALRRTASGGFTLADAVALDALETMSAAERERHIRPTASLVAHLPRLDLDEEASTAFLHGCAVGAGDVARPPGIHAVFADDALLGMADVADGVARPRRLMPVSRI